MVVNMTTGEYLSGDGDSRCVLLPGEHRSVHHKTRILYSRAREMTRKHIVSGIEQQVFDLDSESATPDLLKKIQAGALDNDVLPIKLEKYFPLF